jgi:hypothetical protein
MLNSARSPARNVRKAIAAVSEFGVKQREIPSTSPQSVMIAR